MPVAAEARRQEKWSSREDSRNVVIGKPPSITEPTKTFRGGLAIGDAAQAAPSNRAARQPPGKTNRYYSIKLVNYNVDAAV
jgi:hypothetical protein